ncbi:MAG TPA: hypothetical protein VFK20_02325 [Vicinamibacterales bacterium]|nr:hypothetical protein [Vicinamibacterales bacterium]
MKRVNGFDTPAVQWAFVASGLVLMAVAVWAGFALRAERRALAAASATVTQLEDERDQLQASVERERAAREALALQLGREREASAPASPPTLTLQPIRTRSPRGPQTAVPQTPAPLVELRLVLPANAPAHAAFTVKLRSWTGGDWLWSRGALTPATADGKPAILARVSSDVLTPGPYEFIVTTAGPSPQDVAVYEVSIVRSNAQS